MPVSVTLNFAIVQPIKGWDVRNDAISIERSNLWTSVWTRIKTSPFLWRTQRELLFPCRKYVAKVTEESECERGCDIPWIPGLPLQTWSAALHPASVCKLLVTHAFGVGFLPFAQASHSCSRFITCCCFWISTSVSPLVLRWALFSLFFLLPFCLRLYIDGASSFALCKPSSPLCLSTSELLHQSSQN